VRPRPGPMLCEFIRSPASRRSLCWWCARLDIRDIRVAKRPQVSYTCGWNPIRALRVDRCEHFRREPGADDALQRRGRWRVAGVAT
jgi:hypothetical protein